MDLGERLGVEVVDGQLRWRVIGEVGQHRKWRSQEASGTDVLLWDALRAMAVLKEGAEAEVAAAAQINAELHRQIITERSMPRLTPKGGDRGEFGRQVRRLAQLGLQKVADATEHGNPDDYHVAAGGVAMANRVLVMLDEKPMLEAAVGHEAVDRQELVGSLTRVVDQVRRNEPDPGAARSHGEWRLKVDLLDEIMRLLTGERVVDGYGNVVEPS